MTALPDGILADRLREELQRLLLSPDFRASERNRRFLSYVVEETLAGRGARIKAYSIATEAFGRDDNFDPQLDPIVRIEAGRLRRAMDAYYATAGHDSGQRLLLPRGSYVPTLSQDEGQAPNQPLTAPGRAREMPKLLILPFDAGEADTDASVFGRGLCRELIIGLSRFGNLFVYGPEIGARFAEVMDMTRITGEISVDYVLSGSAELVAGKVHVNVLMTNAHSGGMVWGKVFEESFTPSAVLAVRKGIVDQVARMIAEPYGIIFTDQARHSEPHPADEMSSYEAVLNFFAYWRSFDLEETHRCRADLERAIEADPSYAEAYACLSLCYLNHFRFRKAGEKADTSMLGRSVSLAQKAIDHSPEGSWGYYALGLAYWFMQDVDGSLSALETALECNPNESTILAELGLRHAIRMNWARALPLIETACKRSPGLQASSRIGLFLNHYWHGQYQAALVEARHFENLPIVYGPLCLAVACGKLGHTREAASAVERLLGIDPDYGAKARADLLGRNVHPDLVEALLDGLSLAGLAVPAEVAAAHDSAKTIRFPRVPNRRSLN